jgi:mono/diheme cytochrome c family protein
MPHLNIAATEAGVLADYLSTVMIDDTLETEVPKSATAVARGRELFDRHGCQGCHIVGDRGGFVGPELNGSDARLQPGWTVAWLLDPERWKPGTLQPNHGLTREEAEALTAYTLSLPARKAKVVP